MFIPSYGLRITMNRIYFILAYVCLFICLCITQKHLEGTACTRDGFNGTCLYIHKCFSMVFELKEKKYPPICGFDGKTPIICCTDCPDTHVANISLAVFNSHGGLMWKNGFKAWDACIDYVDQLPYMCKQHVTSSFKKLWDDKLKCHKFEVYAEAPSGGEDAKRGEFPYMGLLGYGEDLDTARWVCGGSVISDKFMLTAGHCIASVQYGPVKYVGLGMLKRSDPVHLWQRYSVKKIIPHPQYKSPVKYNDIALLEIDGRIKFSAGVLPLCLRREKPERQLTVVTALGWGSLGPNKPLADVLQKVEVTNFTDKECSDIYKPHRHLTHGYDPATQICYGDKNENLQGFSKDTCEGDSGGPLVYVGGVSFCANTIIGVTSFGVQCGYKGGAGMYTKVEPYLTWIESIVWA